MAGEPQGAKLRIAARLLIPFVRLPDSEAGFPRERLMPFRALDPEDRVPIEEAHRLLEQAVEETGDPDLGLRAGMRVDLGDGGALDYAIRSAPNVREAIRIATRYARLLSDAVDYHLQVDGSLAMVRMDSRVPLPRAAADFQAASLHVRHLSPHAAWIPGLEWWFPHGRPENDARYRLVFGDTPIRFWAPCFAYVFDVSYLDYPIATADSRLHDVMRRHVDLVLAQLPNAQAFTQRVRTAVSDSLSQGDVTFTGTASKMKMSTRTLARRLLAEGTTFSQIVDDVRRQLALMYVAKTDLHFDEVALLLGFAEASVFHRAFNRWTGSRPLQYRRLAAGSNGGRSSASESR